MDRLEQYDGVEGSLLKIETNDVFPVERRVNGVPTGKVEPLPAGLHLTAPGSFYYPAQKEYGPDGKSFRWVGGWPEYRSAYGSHAGDRLIRAGQQA